MPTETVTCWNCGAANAPEARFCAMCGKPQGRTCPERGTRVDESARFCPTCGIPLQTATASTGPAVALGEARKIVTVLFADLVGSTGLTEALDPEEARDVVGTFYRVAEHAIERFGGRVANLLGDAVLAVFGLPVAHEDDPERAVRAGLAMRDAMPGLNEHLQAAHGLRLEIRVGITTGEVVAASGSTFERDFLISDAVTTAARLQQTAAPGAVLVTDRTYRLAAGAIEFRPLPPLPVKGKAAPLTVWEAVTTRPEPAEVPRLAAPLVGRHAELGLLRHIYERTRDDGAIHLVTVVGQPGVGKSRLLREFLAEVRDGAPPPLVLRGRGTPFGGQVGYHALLDVLKGQAGILDTDAPPTVRAKLDAWLRAQGSQMPDLLPGLLLTFGVEDGPVADPAALRERLFETWTTLLLGLGGDRPVVVALEDMHWADDGTLDLVERLAERGETAALFLICLARPELLERRATWGSKARNGTRIDLRPLRPSESEELAVALSSQGLSPAVRRAVAERAQGNPLFVEELVRMLLEGSTPGAGIPDTVQAVLTARVDRLPPAERRALQAAAVVGRAFWPSAVAQLTGLTSDETATALRGLAGKDLIGRRNTSSIAGEAEYSFRHILIRDVAYGMLPRAQRQRAHAEAARWIEARVGERVEEVVQLLAEHLTESGDDARAVGYLQRAAAKALRLYEKDRAVGLYTQALDAAARARTAPAEVAALYLGRGDAHELDGRYAAAAEDYARGLDAARRAGATRLEAILETRLGLAYHRRAQVDEAATHYGRAVGLARAAGDAITQARATVDLVNIAWDRGEVRGVPGELLEAIAALREAGEPSGLARALNLLAMVRFSGGDATGGLAAAGEALAVARQSGDRQREATSLSYQSVINTFWGRYAEGVRLGRAANVLAEEIKDPRRVAFTTNFVARGLIGLGEWGEALRILEGSLPLVRDVAPIHVPWSLFYLSMLCYELGDPARARQALAVAPVTAPRHPSWREAELLCHLYIARGERDRAALDRVLDELVGLPSGIFVPDDAEAILPVGEGLLEAGRRDDLTQYLERRRVSVETFGAPAHVAGLAIVDARLADAAGRTGAALDLLEQALGHSHSVGDVVSARHAYALRLALRPSDDDRTALRNLLLRVASTLPDGVRESFVQAPDVAPLLS
ncbi:MAG: adenylate/guanylate cyclase domain-containing protein [Armatimonadota bacterium]|nr:adenylate/guanylate cyclase domain-containing protein [Armatimonadota bacterium]MDR7485243.1 adenylate/guanylate cyclase domain-containing protein [Armatimonadota bacterium]MDR7534203.1 adenylate/guanylate cyclase domain-containing protein [Armatimonadota bacterium]MDR7537118.1 adenylate/guanylate cyclase domain-containing protein [Armatimonadota bacterium]